MTANDYFYASSAYQAALVAADLGSGSGPVHPDDETAVDRACEAERAALKAIIATPATSLDEITARAAILSSLINGPDGEGIFEDFWPGLSARIAADLQNLAASATASSAAAETEAPRCAA